MAKIKNSTGKEAKLAKIQSRLSVIIWTPDRTNAQSTLITLQAAPALLLQAADTQKQ